MRKKKKYFKGFYFKQHSDNINIAFIIGYAIDKYGAKDIFIQVITTDFSDIEEYSISSFDETNFYFKIDDNIFSKDGIVLEFRGTKHRISAKLKFGAFQKIKKTKYAPNIMGPFSYLPFMECNHDVISLYHEVNGFIIIDNKQHFINRGTGYIEGDWGRSFPQTYLWTQCNNFSDEKASFFMSYAKINYLKCSFKGLISILYFNNKEYRFSTYNRAKVISLFKIKKQIFIVIKRGKYILKIVLRFDKRLPLAFPKKGLMNKIVDETIDGAMEIELWNKNKLLFSGSGEDAGVEYLNFEHLEKKFLRN